MPSIAKRSLVGYLRDIDALGERLFNSDGIEATEVLLEVEVISHALHRLEQKYDFVEAINVPVEALVGKELKLNSMRDERSISLVNIINKVKSIERTFDFQLKLHQEKKLLAIKTGTIDSTFTYGTTSFNCFASLMDHPSIEGIYAIKEPRVVILGSSQGLLAHFTSYCLPHAKCVCGIEIMPCLHNLARSLLTEDSNCFDNISFNLQDMLTHDLAGYDMVVLTSLCWDKETRRRVAHKLSTELDRDCVIIDYRADTFAEFGLDQDNSYYTNSSGIKRHSDHIISKCDTAVLREILYHALLGNKSNILRQPKRFKLIGLVEGDVSWTSNQRLYIYVTVE